MYPKFLKLSLATGVALALGACASFATTEPEYDRLAQVRAGLTQDQVRSVAGKPDNVTGSSRPNVSALWIYEYSNEWGQRSEFDVTFDARGVVASTYSETLF
jgi:outer membrane protein assembly factor BamE (lipoprotein component of BamABCDE complex)